jgi:hypothetical protein
LDTGFRLARQDVAMNPCAGLRLASKLGPRPERRARLKLSRDELRDLRSTARSHLAELGVDRSSLSAA